MASVDNVDHVASSRVDLHKLLVTIRLFEDWENVPTLFPRLG